MLERDYVMIERLVVDTTIGVFEWEKKIKQRLEINVAMEFDCKQAGDSDNINDALDYSKVTQMITNHVSHSRFELIEKVAEDIATLVLNDARIQQISVEVCKPTALLNADNVKVKIVRTQTQVWHAV